MPAAQPVTESHREQGWFASSIHIGNTPAHTHIQTERRHMSSTVGGPQEGDMKEKFNVHSYFIEV